MQYYQQQMQLAMSEIGTPRYPPDQIGKLVQQRPKEVAPYLINFVAGVGAVLVRPAPYFVNYEVAAKQTEHAVAERQDNSIFNHPNFAKWFWGILVCLLVLASIAGSQ